MGEGQTFCGNCGAPNNASTSGASANAGGYSAAAGGPMGMGMGMTMGNPTARRVAAPMKRQEVSAIIQGVKRVYREKVAPLEARWHFENFHSASLTETDIEAAPMVLLIGQYSVGKTSFIRYLLERNFPGANIGPEPTTDRFMAVMHGPEKTLPGNAVASQQDKPFTGLNKFGMGFLNKFEVSMCLSPILENITFVDTPGVLSGAQQREQRSYDFAQVTRWFAERCDRVLVLFDANKLDISDNFKEAIHCLKGQEDKVRCVLNKADSVDNQALMRVYGALMWALGKVMLSPEVLRVYVGSFWAQPLRAGTNTQLFEAEAMDLLADLRSLPRNATVRRMNEIIKRTKMLKVHVHIIDHLRKQFGFFGKDKKQKKMMEELLEHYKIVQSTHNLAKGDFPNLDRFKDVLEKFDIKEAFPKAREKELLGLDEVLTVDFPNLMKLLPVDESRPDLNRDGNDNFSTTTQDDVMHNPFAAGGLLQRVGAEWVVDSAHKNKYDTIFTNLVLVENKVSGANVRDTLAKSGLPGAVLAKIWALADMDKDGMLDADEFAVAMDLIDSIKSGAMREPPEVLDQAHVPPSKRALFTFD